MHERLSVFFTFRLTKIPFCEYYKQKGAKILATYKTSAACRFSYVILGLAILIGIGCIMFHRQVSRHMAEICEYKGRETATEIVTEAVKNQLQDDSGEYIKINRDSAGTITSVETDSAAVNKLQNKIKTAINDALSEIDEKELSVPVGTLSGITFFSGRGGNVTLKLHQVGAVDTQIKSEFSSAGVNQTKHRMSIIVTAEISAILPLHSTDITICDEYLISETVIVGEVPNVFLNRNSAD